MDQASQPDARFVRAARRLCWPTSARPASLFSRKALRAPRARPDRRASSRSARRLEQRPISKSAFQGLGAWITLRPDDSRQIAADRCRGRPHGLVAPISFDGGHWRSHHRFPDHRPHGTLVMTPPSGEERRSSVHPVMAFSSSAGTDCLEATSLSPCARRRGICPQPLGRHGLDGRKLRSTAMERALV